MDERDDDRPDPDELLRRVRAEEARATRARLHVFFGFAPGVGKTYRMLQTARALKDDGVDVVVGLVETHGRSETARLLEGLEILPRQKVQYRGRVMEELDLDAALARKPAVLLVDELAHTNVPGARHTKRWQDVLELLDAGIDVHTTVNVQHIESLNDVIAQITRVQVRETVPDSLLERADEVELVDIGPEELLERLREGKVYLPEQAQRAADHFFQRGNLLALRELALRRTAERVDVDVRAYRDEHGVEATWPASERILVCVGPAPSSDRLVRAARRMAAGLRSPWVAAWVDGPTPLSPADRERLDRHLRLAETLGGTVVRLTGTRVSQAIIAYSRKHNVTRIVIGKPTHSRARDRLKGSLLDEIVRGSGDIDVHVISGDADDEGQTLRPAAPGPPPPLAGYLWATLAIVATTALALGIRELIPIPDLEVLFLLAVMITAMQVGRGPSVLAAALSVASYDFFFVQPTLTFAVADVRYLLTFAMLFGVGLLMSSLTTRLRKQERAARGREERTALLAGLGRDLGALLEPRESAEVVARRAADEFESAAVVLLPDGAGALRPVAVWPAGTSLDAREVAVSAWVQEHGRLAGLGTDTLPGSRAVCAPLKVAAEPLGVLALLPAEGAPLAADQRDFLDAFCRQAGYAFERARLAEQARAAALKARTEELRSSLLSAVSHDLRTPLASITGSATSLRDDEDLSPETRRELLEAICDEAERLERLVRNLLDMTRLEVGEVALHRQWVPVEELVGSALTRVERRLTGRPITTTLDPTLPMVSVDPVLFEQVFVNLLENAARYTPAGSAIDVTAAARAGEVEIAVADRGPGLPPGEEESLFEKFHRGAHAGEGGVGLGLSICRAIVQAHGGHIGAENRPGGGAVFRVSLPRSGEPPSVPMAEARA